MARNDGNGGAAQTKTLRERPPFLVRDVDEHALHVITDGLPMLIIDLFKAVKRVVMSVTQQALAAISGMTRCQTCRRFMLNLDWTKWPASMTRKPRASTAQGRSFSCSRQAQNRVEGVSHAIVSREPAA